MRIINQKDYQIIHLNHPRYKNIEVIQFDNQIWFNLNDLCQSVKATSKSAINSLDEGSPHLVYIQHPGKEDYIPFVTEQGFLLAETERTQAYKKHILNWAYNEMQEPILPTIDQMIVLASKQKMKLDEHPTPITNYAAPSQQPQSSDCEPFNHNCNLTQLIKLYKERGLTITAQDFVNWLILNRYLCSSYLHRYRPLYEYYDRGYFVDNRKTFNSFYPQRDLRFTPKGQRYFYEKLSAEK